jgi:hypothetical protein
MCPQSAGGNFSKGPRMELAGQELKGGARQARRSAVRMHGSSAPQGRPHHDHRAKGVRLKLHDQPGGAGWQGPEGQGRHSCRVATSSSPARTAGCAAAFTHALVAWRPTPASPGCSSIAPQQSAQLQAAQALPPWGAAAVPYPSEQGRAERSVSPLSNGQLSRCNNADIE